MHVTQVLHIVALIVSYIRCLGLIYRFLLTSPPVVAKRCLSTFAGFLQVSLQATGEAGVLRAAESPPRDGGGAGEFPHTLLVVEAAASRHGAAGHFLSRHLTAKARMIT